MSDPTPPTSHKTLQDIPTLPYATPATSPDRPLPKDIHGAFVKGMLIFCVVGTAVYAAATRQPEIFIPILFIGFVQTAVVFGTMEARLHRRRVDITERRLRHSMIGGFICSAATWLTFFVGEKLLPDLPASNSERMLPLLCIGVVISYAAIAALVLTSNLKTAANFSDPDSSR
jgi:hypothetical protein